MSDLLDANRTDIITQASCEVDALIRVIEDEIACLDADLAIKSILMRIKGLNSIIMSASYDENELVANLQDRLSGGWGLRNTTKESGHG